MKTLYTVLSLFILALPSVASAQAQSFQDLAKYSYPIFTLSNNQQYTGTAFLYRSGDTSYLVSNYHAIKGMSPVKQSISFASDTLYLKYRIRNSYDHKIMPVDVSENVTGKTEIFSMVDRIDLLKVSFVPPADAELYYINDLIEEQYLHAEPLEVVAFGYPTNPGSIPVFYAKQQRLEGKVNPNGFIEYDSSLKLNFPQASDSARAIVNASSRYYYFIRPYAARGYSGAPVFGKFRNADNRLIYRFTGVIFAGQPSTRQTWTIKGAVALQYLQGEL